MKYCLHELFLKINPKVEEIRGTNSKWQKVVVTLERDIADLDGRINDLTRKIAVEQAELSNLKPKPNGMKENASTQGDRAIESDLSAGDQDAIGGAETEETLVEQRRIELESWRAEKSSIEEQLIPLQRELREAVITREVNLERLGDELKQSFEGESLWRSAVNNHSISIFTKMVELFDCLAVLPQRQLILMRNSGVDFNVIPENNFKAMLRESTPAVRSSGLLQLVVFRAFWQSQEAFGASLFSLVHVGLTDASTILSKISGSAESNHVVFLFDHRSEESTLSIVILRFEDAKDRDKNRLVLVDHIHNSPLNSAIHDTYLALVQLLKEKRSLYSVSEEEHVSSHLADNAAMLFALTSFDAVSRSVGNASDTATEHSLREWLSDSLARINSFVDQSAPSMPSHRPIQPITYFINMYRSLSSVEDLVQKAKDFSTFAAQYLVGKLLDMT